MRLVDGTVISADISGFTRLAESLAHLGSRQAAEQLATIVNRCFDPMIDEIVRRGGDVLKFGGDALFVLFEGQGHAQQGCVAAMAMMDMIGAVDLDDATQLSMTVGVASGELPLLLAGSLRRELVVAGPVVDVCLQCESDAEPGEILVHTSTVNALPAGWVEELEEGVFVLRSDLQVRLPAPDPRDPISGLDADAWGQALGSDIASAMSAFAGTVGENRVVSVAFVALPTADLDMPAIDAVIERSIDLCERYGPTLLCTDVSRGGIKLFFASGAPTAGEDDEGAMLAMLSKLVRDPANPPMRAGANRGVVYAGFLGSDTCRTLTVMGDPTNLAARLLGHAPERSIAVADAVLEHARGSYLTTELPPILVRGRIEPVKVHVLGDLEEPRRQQHLARPPFVGREVEHLRLRSLLSNVMTSTGAVVDLVGEAGVGCSRLIEEFLAGVPPTVLRFELNAGVAISGEPFRAVRPLLRVVAGLSETPTGSAQDVDLLASWVAKVASQHADRLGAIAPAFGVEIASEQADATLPEFRMERTVGALCDLVAAALNSPTVIVAEDLQWFDAGSRALIEGLGRRVNDGQWLLVTSSRPDVATPGGPESVLPIEPLSSEDISALVASISDLPLASRTEVARRSGGNPQFAVELARALESDEETCDSMEAQITARIDRLGHAHRVVLRTAAVLGEAFALDVLSELLGEPAPQWLFDGGLLSVDGTEVSFRSRIIRDVAYAGLSSRRRQELHADAAEMLGRLGGDATQLAWHFGEAKDHESCWIHAKAAAVRSIELGLLGDAFDQLSLAVRSADSCDGVASERELVDTLTESFHVGLAAKRHSAALAAGCRALALIEDGPGRVDLLVAVARTEAEAEGDYRAQIEMLEAELTACGSTVDGTRSSAAIRGALAALLYRYSSTSEALVVAQESAEQAAQVNDQGLLARALLITHVCLADLGDPRRSEVGEQLLRVATVAGDKTLLVSAHSNVGLGRQDVGDWDGALEQFALALALADELGDEHRKVFPVVNRAALLAERGQWDLARPILVELHRDARIDRSGYVGAWICSELGRLEACAGRTDDARSWLSTALDWFGQAEADSEIYQLHVSQMAADLAGGHSERVLAASRTIEQPAQVESRQSGRFDTMVGYAHLQQGRPDDALRCFEVAASATTAIYVYGHALALVGLSESETFLGKARSAKRHRAEADGLLGELGVVALPLIPLPR